MWIAVPQDLPEQRVSNLSVKTDLASKFVEDPTFHNKVAVVTVPQPAAMKGAPLNYLPAGAYVELDGKPLETGITRTLSYTVDDKPAAARH